MSGQNRSSAVMQQRRTVAPDALDYFPTPPFATRALCEFLELELEIPIGNLAAWEPACGEGHMARPLLERFASVRASDVHRYELTPALKAGCDPLLGHEHELADFTLEHGKQTDVVASNPPFKLALAFIEAGLRTARVAVAMLVRSAFLEGQERYSQLWSKIPPSFILQFTERVVMLEGRLIQAGAVDPFAEKDGTKASTATAYVWLVWIIGDAGDTRFRWIAPCRERLERPGDYPVYAIETAA
jgi:hypothetical protein